MNKYKNLDCFKLLKVKENFFDFLKDVDIYVVDFN